MAAEDSAQPADQRTSPAPHTGGQDASSPAQNTGPEPKVGDQNAVVTAESGALQPDDEEEEEITDDGDSTFGSLHSSTTSIRDELIQQLREHGRQYQGLGEASKYSPKYMLPMDEQELDRLDFQCHLVWLTLDKQHTYAPIETFHRVLDVGCGTGVWAMQFADSHPETEVLGVDLAPVQPDCVPPNLMFEVDDLERPWNFTKKFDYIHCQLMTAAFQDWPKFFRQSFEFLQPDGHLEVHDIDFALQCDDGSIPATSSLTRWHDLMHEAATAAGFPLDAIPKTPARMREAGFVDVTARTVKWPINQWPRDPKHKLLGRWAHENFSWGCDSMSLALLTRVLGWSAQEVTVFMALVREDLRNRKMHGYWNFWIVYGRKPAAGDAAGGA